MTMYVLNQDSQLIITLMIDQQFFLKSDSHVSKNFCQVKISPSLFRKNIINLFVWSLKLKINEF